MARPEEAITIEELISIGETVNTKYSTFSFEERIKNTNIKISIYNVIWDYIDILKMHSRTVELTDEEYYKYRYKPKLMAFDVYGNTELYFIILMLNNMIDSGTFDLKRLRLLTRSDMENYISLIFNNENKYITLYNNKNSSVE